MSAVKAPSPIATDAVGACDENKRCRFSHCERLIVRAASTRSIASSNRGSRSEWRSASRTASTFATARRRRHTP